MAAPLVVTAVLHYIDVLAFCQRFFAITLAAIPDEMVPRSQKAIEPTSDQMRVGSTFSVQS